MTLGDVVVLFYPIGESHSISELFSGPSGPLYCLETRPVSLFVQVDSYFLRYQILTPRRKYRLSFSLSWSGIFVDVTDCRDSHMLGNPPCMGYPSIRSPSGQKYSDASGHQVLRVTHDTNAGQCDLRRGYVDVVAPFPILI